jgi:hypothetical protein
MMQAQVILINNQIIVLPNHHENMLIDHALLQKYHRERGQEILKKIKIRDMGEC